MNYDEKALRERMRRQDIALIETAKTLSTALGEMGTVVLKLSLLVDDATHLWALDEMKRINGQIVAATDELEAARLSGLDS